MNISHITLSRGPISLARIDEVLAREPATHGFFRSITLGSSVLAYIAMYYMLAPRFPTKKQKSWLITTIASALMTIASIPFVWDYIRSWGSVTSLRSLPVSCILSHAYSFLIFLYQDLELRSLSYISSILSFRPIDGISTLSRAHGKQSIKSIFGIVMKTLIRIC